MKHLLSTFFGIFILSLLCVSCSKKDHGSYTNISSQPVVLISHDEFGNLLGFISLDVTEDISSIVISPSKGHQKVYVTALGTKIHESIADKDITVSSEIREGWLGYVEAQFQNNAVIALDGNGIQSPSPITSDTLSKVDDLIASGTTKFPDDFPVRENQLGEQDGAGQAPTRPESNDHRDYNPNPAVEAAP